MLGLLSRRRAPESAPVSGATRPVVAPSEQRFLDTITVPESEVVNLRNSVHSLGGRVVSSSPSAAGYVVTVAWPAN